MLLRVLILGALCVFGCGPSTVPIVIRSRVEDSEPLSEVQQTRLRSFLAELARPPFGTGAVLSLSLRGNVISFSDGTLREHAGPVGERTRFNIASVSKLLTAARIVTLDHEGRLHLDDSLRQHLPGVMLIDATGRDRSSDVTIRQILMHRGGLPTQAATVDPRIVSSGWTDPELLRKLTSHWAITLHQEPGAYEYSNLGYALLGAIIERIEGRTFAECMQDYLARIGMNASTFWPAELTNAAHGRVEVNGAVLFNEPLWYGSRYGLPFTGLWASMPDMVRFGQLLIAAHANAGDALHEMTVLDVEQGHGLGPVHRTRFDTRSFEHDGAGPGFLAWFLVIPTHEVVLAIACNSDGEADGGELARRFAEVVSEMLDVVIDEPIARRD